MDAAQVHRDAALQPGTTAANIARLNRRAANAVRQARTQRATAERLRTAAYLFSSFGFLNSMYFAVFPGSGAIQIRLYQSMMSSVGTGT